MTSLLTPPTPQILNVNLGILGHVDSGKTSLSATLSTIFSTSSADRSKQSRTRGMTLELGFSSFLVPSPFLTTHLPPSPIQYPDLQFTLVDCPGHGTLIRQILNASSIIDGILLVVDAGKGIQAMTVECIVLGDVIAQDRRNSKGSGNAQSPESKCKNVIALNKCDLIPGGINSPAHLLILKTLRSQLKGTSFEDSPIVEISARPGGGDRFYDRSGAVVSENDSGKKGGDEGDKVRKKKTKGGDKDRDREKDKTSSVAANTGSDGEDEGNTMPYGIDLLVETIVKRFEIPFHRMTPSVPLSSVPALATTSTSNENNKPFLFQIDHCFPIKGSGTVLTGTVLSGHASAGDVITLPTLGFGKEAHRKIKSMQKFHKKAENIDVGERAAICVSNLDATLFNKGYACTNNHLTSVNSVIIVVKRVKQYLGSGVKNGGKLHFSVGCETCMGEIYFFGASKVKGELEQIKLKEYMERGTDEFKEGDFAGEYVFQNGYVDNMNSSQSTDADADVTVTVNNKLMYQYALIKFDTPLTCPPNSLIIGSRLDQLVAPHSKTTTNTNIPISVSGEDESNDLTTGSNSSCRLSYFGRILHKSNSPTSPLKSLRFYTIKEKTCTVCKIGDLYVRENDGARVQFDCICENLFTSGTNMNIFIGVKLSTLDTGTVCVTVGVIASAYGIDGKFKVDFPTGVILNNGDILKLSYKKYNDKDDKSIKLIQDHVKVEAYVNRKAIDAPVAKTNSKLDGNGESKKKVKIKGVTVLGEIEKVKENGVYIVSGLFKPEDDINLFINDVDKVKLVNASGASVSVEGKVIGAFGKAGKCKVSFEVEMVVGEVGGKVSLFKRKIVLAVV